MHTFGCKRNSTNDYRFFDVNNIIHSMPGYDPKFRESTRNESINAVLTDLRLKQIPREIEEGEFEFEVIQLDDYDLKEEEYIRAHKKCQHMVVFNGDIMKYKRIDCLLYAAKKYEAQFEDDWDDGILTLIIGKPVACDDTAELGRLQALNDKLKNHNVYFVNEVEKQALVRLYNIADLGVFPVKNANEGDSMRLLECLACGTPVIGVNSGRSSDFVDDIVGRLIDEDEDNQRLGEKIGDAVIDGIENKWKQKKGKNCVKVAGPYTRRARMEIMLKNTREMC